MKNANKYENKIDSLGLSKTSTFYMLIGNEWKLQTNMKIKLTLLVFQKHHNFTCWLAINEKCKQIWKQNWLSWSFKNITILHVDWQWMKMQTNMKTKFTLLVFQKHHNFTCWLAMNEKCKQYDNGLSWSFKNITILHVDWQWMKNANNITKFTLLVFQKHHNFTCWLAMNEKCKQIW